MQVLTMIAAVVLLGCGSAEARPAKNIISVHVAFVGDLNECRLSPQLIAVQQELTRVTRSRVLVYFDYDLHLADERPDLNTLDAFWDGRLGDYWRSRMPAGPGIRAVILPPLQTPGGLMYGGMSYRDFFFIQGDGTFYPWRTTYAMLHELGHQLGKCGDVCREGQPSIMCYSDIGWYKTRPEAIHYDAICERQIRRRLGLRAGRQLCVGEDC